MDFLLIPVSNISTHFCMYPCNHTFDTVALLQVEASIWRQNWHFGLSRWGRQGWGKADGLSATSGIPSPGNNASWRLDSG